MATLMQLLQIMRDQMVQSNNRDPRSPWLESIGQPEPASDASFVEYLRWMRWQSNNDKLNSAKLLELLEKVREGDYSQSLERLTQRTKRLATDWFPVECSWRIRVGGTTGPESMLLPAFDALGMPHIPSTTLKGVARATAKQDGASAEDIKKIFGDIDPTTSMGLVTFLDAYPLPGEDTLGGLHPDMANPIWKWEDSRLQYSPNPNPFLSLLQPTFVIGLRQQNKCSEEILLQVKKWLLKGLIQGIGSRVNSGYGELKLERDYARHFLSSIPKEERPKKNTLILQVPFEIEGQLIHGYQRANWQQDDDGNWQPKPKAAPEVRPVAFRSMLRYWFRAFALGVLSASEVRDLELLIFGGIEPQPKTGLFRLEITNADNNSQDNTYREGTLILRHSPLTIDDRNKRIIIYKLLKSLTWIMFHIGGIGQGARRPYYQRPGNPSHRGVNLTPKSDKIIKPESISKIWELPKLPQNFCKLFQKQIKNFYSAFNQLSTRDINYHQSLTNITVPTDHTWVEAVDINCEILVLRKDVKHIATATKSYPLKLLHEQFHNLEEQNYTQAKSLCGGIKKESTKDGDEIDRDVTPSPIWIKDLQKYQVVTVFGATEEPRKYYLQTLKESISKSKFDFDTYAQIWPISSNEENCNYQIIPTQ
ncbi:MAG: RAMP superfamily CRISPR-associated protein [Calothrix sp. MO_192.B10]|nr:RAMP superfamily CRISPR-associated protein [Calothrix sp. MO_192.B10]